MSTQGGPRVWSCLCACFAFYVIDPGPLSFAVGWELMSVRHLALSILTHAPATAAA